MNLPDKILWIGTYAQGEYLEQMLKKKVYVQAAANRVQGYYLNEIEKQTEIPIDILSALVTVPYPSSTEKRIEGHVEHVSERTTLYNVGFLNYPYVNILSQKKHLMKAVEKWCRENKDKRVWVFVYSMRLPFLEAARKVKKDIKDAIVVNIVPDLPQYMHSKSSIIRKILDIPYQKAMYNAQKSMDGFVLYTQSMEEYLPSIQKPMVVIEGLFGGECKDISTTVHATSDDVKIVLYAGTLEKKYGVHNLVEGFMQTNMENIELHLYGIGEYVGELGEISAHDKRVQYKGLVTPEEMYNKLCDADLLVNPRPSAPEYTKFSFPSKVFEYMASGTPVLMTRLPGIGEEYYNYVYAIDDESPEGIAKILETVFSVREEERIEFGKRAQEFIYKNKSAKSQIAKLLTFISTIGQ